MIARPMAGQIPRREPDDRLGPNEDARASAEFFCRAFMESEEDDAMFAAEAEAWLERLGALRLGPARETWPDVLELRSTVMPDNCQTNSPITDV